MTAARRGALVSVDRRAILTFLAGIICVLFHSAAQAGMGVPIPDQLIVERLPQFRVLTPWIDARLQTLSFFIAAVLLCAWIVQGLWALLRRDWPKLPRLRYRGALAGTLLWGLVSVIVLTMISGARELMTPGAWKQHGWTYRLVDDEKKPVRAQENGEGSAVLKQRREAMQSLWTHLSAYADDHSGKFPDNVDADDVVWIVPTHPKLRYVLVPGKTRANAAYDLLAAEPRFHDRELMVLFTNGSIVTMTPRDLDQFLVFAKRLQVSR